MSKYHTLAQAMAAAEARCNTGNAQAGKESKPANDPLGLLGRSHQETEETKSLVSSPTKRVFDSTGTNLPTSVKWSDDPETQILLERYGDIMGIVDNHPAFQKAVRQWNVFPQAMTEACKLHGVAKVLDAIRYTANYPAAKSKAGFFWAVLKNGKKALK